MRAQHAPSVDIDVRCWRIAFDFEAKDHITASALSEGRSGAIDATPDSSNTRSTTSDANSHVRTSREVEVIRLANGRSRTHGDIDPSDSTVSTERRSPTDANDGVPRGQQRWVAKSSPLRWVACIQSGSYADSSDAVNRMHPWASGVAFTILRPPCPRRDGGACAGCQGRAQRHAIATQWPRTYFSLKSATHWAPSAHMFRTVTGAGHERSLIKALPLQSRPTRG